MTFRQLILKKLYPVFKWLRGKSESHAKHIYKNNQPPARSFYDLRSALSGGGELSFDSLKNKKVLLVNTASDCGYTAQYAELQQLADRFRNDLVILGFPANDFKQQEKGNDNEILAFCKKNYGVEFPLMRKSVVKKTNDQNEVFEWLTHSSSNGWNDQGPVWNFSKYLVDERGYLTDYFGPSISPLDEVIVNRIAGSV